MATEINLVNDGAVSDENQDNVLPPPVEPNLVLDGAAIGDDQNKVPPQPVESNLANDGVVSGDNENDVPPPVVSNLNPMASEWKPAAPTTDNTRPDDKLALFMTFSRGYPVTVEDVHTYFERKFGADCVKHVFIEKPKRLGEQAKFGHVMFKASCIPLAVLNENGGDGEKARHYIGGRAVWFKTFRGDL